MVTPGFICNMDMCWFFLAHVHAAHHCIHQNMWTRLVSLYGFRKRCFIWPGSWFLYLEIAWTGLGLTEALLPTAVHFYVQWGPGYIYIYNCRELTLLEIPQSRKMQQNTALLALVPGLFSKHLKTEEVATFLKTSLFHTKFPPEHFLE